MTGLLFWLAAQVAFGVLAALAAALDVALARRFPRLRAVLRRWLGDFLDWPDIRHALCPVCGRPRFRVRPSGATPYCLCEEPPMAGYANRVMRLGFPQLTEEGQPELFITIRNPRVVPPDDLAAYDIQVDANGMPTDAQKATERSAQIIARLIVAWRMYDATEWGVDEAGELLDQKPLPLPATPDLVRKLPAEAMMELNRAIQDAVNPR